MVTFRSFSRICVNRCEWADAASARQREQGKRRNSTGTRLAERDEMRRGGPVHKSGDIRERVVMVDDEPEVARALACSILMQIVVHVRRALRFGTRALVVNVRLNTSELPIDPRELIVDAHDHQPEPRLLEWYEPRCCDSCVPRVCRESAYSACYAVEAERRRCQLDCVRWSRRMEDTPSVFRPPSSMPLNNAGVPQSLGERRYREGARCACGW